MSTKNRTWDHDRLINALPGYRRVHRKGKVVEVFTCPSCGERDALTLSHPRWLDYPKPVCWNCPDVEIFKAVGLSELAFRGESPPLVACYVPRRYYRLKGEWPTLGDGTGEWPGGCRKCGSCRDWMARYQAYTLGPEWVDALVEAPDGPCSVWSVEVAEVEHRRLSDSLRRMASKRGGAVGCVPTVGGRFFVASFVVETDDRVTRLRQRLRAEGTSYRDADSPRGVAEAQLEEAIADAFLRRRWKTEGREYRHSFREYARHEAPDTYDHGWMGLYSMVHDERGVLYRMDHAHFLD